MSNLKYKDYSQYYADNCRICCGIGHITHEGVRTMCICQHTAKMKWRFEQLEVMPRELKYKDWGDFCGVSNTGDHKLTDNSFVKAKEKALKYCFGSDNISVINNRSKTLIVHNHLKTGRNVIITGVPKSGKTLLAILIIKEVVYACRIYNLDITFRCIKSNILQNESRWDKFRTINHVLLDELKDVDFLIIDNIDKPKQGGHKDIPPDTIALDSLFYHRIIQNKPTIIICSDNFWECSIHPQYQAETLVRWGDAFASLLLNKDNVVIRLYKEMY